MGNIIKYLEAYHYVYVFAILISLIHDLTQRRKLHLLTIFLFSTSFLEIFVVFWEYNFFRNGNTNITYNLNSHATIIFYFFLLGFNKKDFLYRLLFILWLLITGIVFLINGMFALSIETYLFGLIIIVFGILKKWFDLIFNTNFSPLQNDISNWLGLGIVIFFFCSFPMLVFVDNLIINNSEDMGYFYLLSIGNIFLSLGYLIATIVKWKNPIYIS